MITVLVNLMPLPTSKKKVDWLSIFELIDHFEWIGKNFKSMNKIKFIAHSLSLKIEVGLTECNSILFLHNFNES